MGAGLYNSFNIPLCLKHFIIKREKKKKKKQTHHFICKKLAFKRKAR